MNYFLYEQADLLYNLLFVLMSFAKEDACHVDVMAVPPTTNSTDLAREDNSQDDLGDEPPTTDDLETHATPSTRSLLMMKIAGNAIVL